MTGLKRILGTLLLSLLPLLPVLPAAAMENADWPSYYRVSDMGAGGTLKVRSEPVAGGEVIGEYGAGAGPIEILKIENGWGNVIANEGNGWVNMAHLQQISVPMIGQSKLPRGLVCGGTEPFWNIGFSEDKAVYSRMGEGEQILFITRAAGFEGRPGPDGFIQASGASEMVFSIVSARQCSDGMSERTYGWWISLLRVSADGTVGVDGCCSLSGQ